jgi:hypothetical protein
MFVIAEFRQAFPEFGDTAKYPDSMLSFWGEVAEQQVVERRWRRMTRQGQSLYVAHEITLAAQNYNAGNVGGIPGGTGGPINSKTVGSVTAAYDTQQTAEKDAGYWNLTTYGKQFIHLARIFGSGPVQLWR